MHNGTGGQVRPRKSQNHSPSYSLSLQLHLPTAPCGGSSPARPHVRRVGGESARAPLTWLHFMPSAWLTAAARGAPLARVKWLFTRTVHFVLHGLEALRGAERTNGTRWKALQTTSLGERISGWKKARGGSNWATRRSPRTLFRLLFSWVSHWMWNKVSGRCCSKCLGLILLSLKLPLLPHPVPFSFEELVAGCCSRLHLRAPGGRRRFVPPRAAAGTSPSAVSLHITQPLWHPRKDKDQISEPFKKSLDCFSFFFYFSSMFSHLPLGSVHSKSICCAATIVQTLMEVLEINTMIQRD